MLRVPAYIEIFTNFEIQFSQECIENCGVLLDNGHMTEKEIDAFLSDFILDALRTVLRKQDQFAVMTDDELDEWTRTTHERGVYECPQIIVNPEFPKTYYTLN